MDTKASVEEHIKECSYNSAAREGNKTRDTMIETLIQENKSAREDIDFLFTSLRGLSKRSEQLEAEKDRELVVGGWLSHFHYHCHYLLLVVELIAHVDRMSAELADARRERQMILVSRVETHLISLSLVMKT